MPTTPPTQGLYLQLSISDGFDDHDPDGSISLTLVPAVNQSPEASLPDHVEASTQSPLTPITALFAALSACANLHPDPASPTSSIADIDDSALEGYDGVDEGPVFDYDVLDSAGGNGLPPPMPGSGGWITAENVDQFFDEHGNWQGRGLGPGAGIVRAREDEDEDTGTGEIDGEKVGDGEDTKWRRTD